MSDGFIIIDRRKNPNAKSLGNRQRFIERVRRSVRESAKKSLGGKSLSDDGETVVSVPTEGIKEPRFRHDPGKGEWDYILPGNDRYIEGDLVDKPEGGGGGGGGGNRAGEGEAEDDFEFAISYEEFLSLVFDDLELPDLVKRSAASTEHFVQRRAGTATDGSPTNLDVEKTMIAGLSRRIALRTPKMKAIRELEEELENTEDEERRAAINAEIETLRRRANLITFLDDVDLRYRRFVKDPKPITQAVMVCIMDVSYSMGEREKIIAKKFFLLLHLFLKRRYRNTEVVFIRHHDEATECDEEAFFTSRESGGTKVSTAYQKSLEILSERYGPDWNIYVAQASDGDNYDNDNSTCLELLDKLLPQVQHMIYVEIARETHHQYYEMGVTLWDVIREARSRHENLDQSRVHDEREVVPVFRHLFAKERAK